MSITLIDVLRLPREVCAPVHDYDVQACSMASRSARRALSEAHGGRLPHFKLAVLVHGPCRRVAWACNTFPAVREKAASGAPSLAELAAGAGAVDVLRYCAAHWSSEFGVGVCREAARAGEVEILQLLRSLPVPSPWDGSVCANAASGGQLHALQWLRAHGCPWSDMTTAWAEVNRHPRIKQWALENGCDYSEELVVRLRMARMMQAMR